MPANKSGLAFVEFAEHEKGFAKQYADHTRSWGLYASGPAPIGQIRNTLGRSFGSAISGQNFKRGSTNYTQRSVSINEVEINLLNRHPKSQRFRDGT